MRAALFLLFCLGLFSNAYAKYENIWIKDNEVDAYVKEKSTAKNGTMVLPFAEPRIGTKEEALTHLEELTKLSMAAQAKAKAHLEYTLARPLSDYRPNELASSYNGIKGQAGAIKNAQDSVKMLETSLANNAEIKKALEQLPPGAKVDFAVLFPGDID